jgi:hypothetical protein
MAFILTPRRRRIIAGVLLIPLVLLALYIWLSLTWTYSSGERAGYVQKFSKKGWICKTWEGELAMVALPGTLSEKFLFTVRSDSIAARINESLGKRVAITYQQHVGLPTTCFGETGYWVSNVKVVE